MTDTYEIIITKGGDRYDEYDQSILSAVSDWSVVNREEYLLLNKYLDRGKYTMITRVDRGDEFLPKLIKDFVKLAKAEEDRVEKAKAIAIEKKNKALLKKKAKSEAEEKRLLEELSKKYKGIV